MSMFVVQTNIKQIGYEQGKGGYFIQKDDKFTVLIGMLSDGDLSELMGEIHATIREYAGRKSIEATEERFLPR